jgi:DNA-binding transcriptional regulator GbsR (MarR family)
MQGVRTEGVEAARLRLIDTVGRLMEFWGFRAPLGRVWALLYLAPEPLSAGEVGEALRMSGGAVSAALGELVGWGAARKAWRPGARRSNVTLYEAEPDVWKAVTRVLRERELPLVREAASAFHETERALAAVEGTDARAAFERGRVETLAALARVGERLLDDVTAARAPDEATAARTIVAALAALTSLSRGAGGQFAIDNYSPRSVDDHSD